MPQPAEELTFRIRHDETPLKLIVNHLVLPLHLGVASSSTPRSSGRFFIDAPVTERASVLGQLGWQFFHDKEIDAEILERAGALWDSRFAAVAREESEPAMLVEFDWWIRCGHFDNDWWLPRLTDLAEKFQFDGRAHIGDELEATSKVDIAGALKALNLLIRKESATAFMPYGLRRAAPVVLTRALESDDPTTVAVADDLINYFVLDTATSASRTKSGTVG